MAQRFNKKVGLRCLLAAMSVTACVATSVAFAQSSNYSNAKLNWQSPAVNGQRTPTTQPSSQYQLVQHVEPTYAPNLLPPVNMIDNNTSQPVNGTRVAQGPGTPGAPGTNAYIDTVTHGRGRPGSVNSPSLPGTMSAAPSVDYPTLDDSAINRPDAPIRTPKPNERITECGDPREIGSSMGEISVLIDVDVNWNDLQPCSINIDEYRPRAWQHTCLTYNPSLLCTTATYFEHVQVERYGHSWGPFLQPVMSAAHFYGSVLFLPYKMGLTPPTECVYTVGYYRPGSCAPYMIDPIPFSLRAGLAQAGTVVGLGYAIP